MMICPHCNGKGLERHNSECNCRYCGGSGLLKDAIIQHLANNSESITYNKKGSSISLLAILEKDYEKVVDILIDETIRLIK